MKKITVAIDGPSGSGKGTTARAVAKKLGYIYLDSGAIYRALTLYFIENNIDYTETEKIISEFEKINISFSSKNGNILIGGIDRENEIRTKKVAEKVSFFATRSTEKLREFVTEISQKIIKNKGVVLEGRDAAAVLAPDAELKIYLDCDIKERARRRFLQLNNSENTEKSVLENLEERDFLDKKNIDIARKEGIVIDTTNETIESQVQKILNLVKKKI